MYKTEQVPVNLYGDTAAVEYAVRDLKREKIMNDLKLEKAKNCQALNGCTRTATTSYKNGAGRTMRLCDSCNNKRIEAIKKAKRK